VNEGKGNIANVEMYTGGFDGSGESLIELNRWTKRLGALKSGGSLFIENLDYGMLDFVLWYHFDITFCDDARLKAWFQMTKGRSLTDENYRYVDALKDSGHCFALEELSPPVDQELENESA
jgi:hypothetical protein